MPRFRLLAVCMAVGVTFNHFHCLGTTARAAGVVAELIELARVQESAPREMVTVPKCENETGCICRGAIFISAPAIDGLDLAARQWVTDPSADLLAAFERPSRAASSAAFSRQDLVRPIAGRALRAWLASFLI